MLLSVDKGWLMQVGVCMFICVYVSKICNAYILMYVGRDEVRLVQGGGGEDSQGQQGLLPQPLRR
jgi:hypothetical protein